MYVLLFFFFFFSSQIVDVAEVVVDDMVTIGGEATVIILEVAEGEIAQGTGMTGAGINLVFL